MMHSAKIVLLLLGYLLLIVYNVNGAEQGMVNLVKPVQAPLASPALTGTNGVLTCNDGNVLQKSGRCCPKGTNNSVWSSVCTPNGTIDDQIFNLNNLAHYCPSANMFIVSDKKRNWISCADSDSKAFYPVAKKSEGSEFCMKHGYGYLIKIKPWGTVGCIKIGDSQGDGCIEAGSCSFTPGQ